MYNFTLYLTTDCNFKCSYCYEDYKDHLSLNEKTLVKSLEFIMNYGDRGKILLDFLGGEPLLKMNLIYKAVDYIKQHYPDRTVKYYITTNGSLMNDDFIFFMKEYAFTVRLSFDGNKKTHDLNRASKDGISCHEKILENIHKVKESGIQYSVRMTITKNTIPFMFENIQYLHEQGLNNICMIMDVNLELADELFETFRYQVEEITKYYILQYEKNNKFSIDQFDGKMLNFLCDFGNCFSMCDAGLSNFKLMPDGAIYPCGFLTSEQQYKIGSIQEGVNVNKARNLVTSSFDRHNLKCNGCSIRDFCHGMKCGFRNLIQTGKINIPSETECQCEHVFYNAMVKILDHYLEQPQEILEHTLGTYIAYCKEFKLKLSKYGMKVEQRLINEK